MFSSRLNQISYFLHRVQFFLFLFLFGYPTIRSYVPNQTFSQIVHQCFEKINCWLIQNRMTDGNSHIYPFPSTWFCPDLPSHPVGMSLYSFCTCVQRQFQGPEHFAAPILPALCARNEFQRKFACHPNNNIWDETYESNRVLT